MAGLETGSLDDADDLDDRKGVPPPVAAIKCHTRNPPYLIYLGGTGYEYEPNLSVTTMAAIVLRKTTKKGNMAGELGMG